MALEEIVQPIAAGLPTREQNMRVMNRCDVTLQVSLVAELALTAVFIAGIDLTLGVAMVFETLFCQKHPTAATAWKRISWLQRQALP
jgi:hypothetical protein